MARTQAGTALTDLHRKQQLALKAQVIAEILKLYPMWVPDNPGSYQALEEALLLLVQARSSQSAALSARYYELYRVAETGLVRATVPLAVVATEEVIREAIGATARGGTYRALVAGKPLEQALKNGLVQVAGAITKQVEDTGRRTIMDETGRDDRCLGWCRVTGGKPCAWCSMLASRGPVYKGDANSIDIWDHEHGDCSAEPAYDGYVWPAKNRELQRLWQETKHDKDTTPLNAFRRALNGDTPAE